LADSGVNVVMATHSLDMIKALEVHTKGKDGDFIAVNHFTKELVSGSSKKTNEPLLITLFFNNA
jgi:hypothetical protein